MCATIPQFAKGFAEDASRIIFNFKNNDDSSFKCFSEIWKDMNFGQIFVGRRTAAEVMEISEEYLNIAKYFAIYIDEPKIKIGGLFLLYSIYYIQPFSKFAKIRLLNSEWVTLKEWWLKLNRVKDDEPIYIFLKLYYDNAFKFVLGNYAYGLEKCFLKNFKDFPNTIMMPYHIVTENYSMTNEDRKEFKQILEDVASLGVEYNKLRKNLNFQMNLNTNIPTLLNNLFNKTNSVLKQSTEEQGSETEAELNEKLGLKRKAIKQKAAEFSGTKYSNTSSAGTNINTSNDEETPQEEIDD